MKIKIGDRVRALSDGSYRGVVKIGEIYEVSQVYDSGNIRIINDSLLVSLYMYDFEVELVKEQEYEDQRRR